VDRNCLRVIGRDPQNFSEADEDAFDHAADAVRNPRGLTPSRVQRYVRGEETGLYLSIAR
jgi:hypothetical protein